MSNKREDFSRRFCLFLLVCLLAVAPARSTGARRFTSEKAVQTSSPARVSGKLLPSYPDGTTGLERFFKDYIKLQRTSDRIRTNEYLQSLALPDPEGWFSFVFGSYLGRFYKDAYLSHRDSDLRTLSLIIDNALADGFKDVRVLKYEKSCKNYIIATRYPVLRAEVNAFPLYEVNLLKTPFSFRTFWAFAYVDDGFRFVGALAPPQHFPPSFDESNSPIPRVKVDSKIQASKLLSQQSPPFPPAAKNKGFSGVAATLRVFIATDGAVKEALVTEGDCYFSDSAVVAVKKWRYAPTIIDGKAVEVETEVQVKVQR